MKRSELSRRRYLALMALSLVVIGACSQGAATASPEDIRQLHVFEETFQPKFDDLPVVPVDDSGTEATFHTVEFNDLALPIDDMYSPYFRAIRFTMPSQGYVIAAFTSPILKTDFGTWGFIPADGSQFMMASYLSMTLTADVEGIGSSGDEVILMSVKDEYAANESYIMWFGLTDDQPFSLVISLRVSSTGDIAESDFPDIISHSKRTQR